VRKPCFRARLSRRAKGKISGKRCKNQLPYSQHKINYVENAEKVRKTENNNENMYKIKGKN